MLLAWTSLAWTSLAWSWETPEYSFNDIFTQIFKFLLFLSTQVESFLIFNFFDETIGVSKVSLETGGFFKGLKKWFYFKTIEKGISLISIQEFCRRPLVLKF